LESASRVAANRSAAAHEIRAARRERVRITVGPLHGGSSDIAIEEVVLAYERLEVATA